MASFNKVILIGNMTADPELKQTPAGLSVCSFSIAVQRRYSRDDQESTADFFNISSFGKTAEFVSRYFHKGNPILVCGEIQNNNYTDKNGVKHYSTRINASEVSFVASASENHESATSTYTPSVYGAPTFGKNAPQFEDLPDDGSLPF